MSVSTGRSHWRLSLFSWHCTAADFGGFFCAEAFFICRENASSERPALREHCDEFHAR